MGKVEADWMICSSHLFAHHARFSGLASHAEKFVYAYTPARYLWTPELDNRGNNPLIRQMARPFKKLDRSRAKEATSIAGISNYVRKRIADTWEQDSVLIYPPVDVGSFVSSSGSELTFEEERVIDSLPKVFILGASRFIPYKRLDLVIAAGARAGINVVLAGNGPCLPQLKQMAEEHPGLVTFVDRPSHALLRELYRRALVFVFPPIEDFGIMPVEAMACGTPVIGNREGGAAETIIHGRTGFLVDDFTGKEIQNVIASAATISAEDCIDRAWRFDNSVFRANIKDWINV
ncbi:glycosyltransferase [Pseudarthrobacter scleromae]|uniref:glycosyltransferase n=1 Tax=Pseudarthrobacter scleromae TaxID=158897 RepID=UPI003CFC4987